MTVADTPMQVEINRMAHFHALDRQQQEQAIRRLALTGMTDGDIARACQLSAEMVKRVIGQHREQRP